MKRVAVLALFIFFPTTPSFSQGPYHSVPYNMPPPCALVPYPAAPYAPVPCPVQIPYDVQFLDALMQHNRNAIQLMQVAQARARNPHVKALAQQILYERRAELPPLTQIRYRIGKFVPPYINYGLPGLVPIESEIARLSTVPADQFDRVFVESAVMMQQAGVHLCEDALGKSRDPSVRGIAALIRNKLGQSLVALQQMANIVS